jgi:hypothetical protein
MFWFRSGCLAYNLTNFPRVLINFPDFFHNISNMTWTAPSLNCKYPLMCVHTSHQPYGYPPLHCAHDNKHIRTHGAVCDTFVAIVRGVWLSHGARTTTCAFFKHLQFLPLISQYCAHQRWHLHFSRCCCRPKMNGFIPLILHHPKICYFWCGSNQKMELLWLTPYWSIPPLSSGSIWMFT